MRCAEAASVSEATRKRVLEAAEQLNYKVDKNASGDEGASTRAPLHSCFSQEIPPDNPRSILFTFRSLDRWCAAASDRGYDLLISFQQLSSDWHVDYEDSRKADGIILLGYGDYVQYSPKLEKLVERGTHFVLWGIGVKSVKSERPYRQTTKTAASAPRAIFLNKVAAKLRSSAPGARDFPKFKIAGADIAVPFAPPEIEPDERLRLDAAPNECDGRAAVSHLLQTGVEFDSIFAGSDVAAIGAMHALQQAGRPVPETAVVGFDDIPAALLASPPLTTVSQDSRGAAEALIDTLIQSIETGKTEDRILPVRLTVRESTLVPN